MKIYTKVNADDLIKIQNWLVENNINYVLDFAFNYEIGYSQCWIFTKTEDEIIFLLRWSDYLLGESKQ